MFRAVAVIPVFDHDSYLVSLVDACCKLRLPCIIVDDGSGCACAQELDRLALVHAGHVTLVRHGENRGKGAAVLSGLASAHEGGFTHVLQIDADGQHDVNDVPSFLAASQASPQAFVVGQPIFDDSIPRGRLYARYLTHAMVSLNTLSPQLRDAMCGFRVYPIAPLLALSRRVTLGRRMDFDIEVLVRLDWDGVPMVLHPTRVQYPRDGVSHFHLLLDNVLITRLHTMLFFGMLRRAPSLVARRWNGA